MNNRVGEKRVMNCGLEAEIVAYRNSKDIDVKFSDGIKRYNVDYSAFKRGQVLPKRSNGVKASRLGERQMMSCGMQATIITYRNSDDITIRFEDGSIKTNVQYRHFIRGNVSPIHQCRYRLVRLGNKAVSICGLYAEIINYRSSKDIDIRFEDGSIIYNKYYVDFKRGYGHPTLRFTNGSNVLKGSTLSTFSVEKLAYRLKDPRDVFYVCECQKCHLRDILTPREMLDHTC